MFSGQGADTGGGGTSKGFSVEMRKLNHLSDDEEFFISACSSHSHNLTIKYPAEKCLGAGEGYCRKYCQLFFIAHALQNEFEPREFRLL